MHSPFEGVIMSCIVSFTPSPEVGKSTLPQVLVDVLDLLLATDLLPAN